MSLLFIAEIYKPEDDDEEENMTTSKCSSNVPSEPLKGSYMAQLSYITCFVVPP